MKISIGAGKTKKNGFTSIDAYSEYADIKAFAHDTGFEKNTIDEIFCSHMLEHVDRGDLDKTILHWFDILKPGGKIVVLVPNAELYIAEWLDAVKNKNWEHLEQWGTRWIMGWEAKGVGMYHTNLFHPETLKRLFEKNGFTVLSSGIVSTRVKNTNHFEYRAHGDIECIITK